MQFQTLLLALAATLATALPNAAGGGGNNCGLQIVNKGPFPGVSHSLPENLFNHDID